MNWFWRFVVAAIGVIIWNEGRKPPPPPEPETKPPDPETKPPEPEIKPTEPEKKPPDPEIKPTEPEIKPPDPEIKPPEPEIKPPEPETKPPEPEIKPTDPETKPPEPEIKPTDPESKPETKPPELETKPTKPKTKQTPGQSRPGRTQEPSEAELQTEKPKPPKEESKLQEKCELICEEIQSTWCVYLKLISTVAEPNFWQNGKKLVFDGNKKCCLTNFSDVIKHGDSGEETSLFKDDEPLIFRLGKDWDGTGKQVHKVVKNRHYVIIAPNDWHRTGQPRNEPGYCENDEFTAHFFFWFDTDMKDGFDGKWNPTIGKLNFAGESIIYDNSHKGDLFGKNLPELQGEGWEKVSWVRVGKEGIISGKKDDGRWDSEPFCPRTKSLTEVIGDHVGWFYVRVYGDDKKRIDSFDFRFSKSLAQILVNNNEYTSETVIVPGDKGHDDVRVCFVDENGGNLPAQLRRGNSHVKMEGDIGIVKPCPKVPMADFTEWKLGDVEVDIMIPRVWWKLGDEEWRDTPIKINREKFYDDFKEEKIEIYTPMHMRSIDVGINGLMKTKWGKICRNLRRCKIELDLYQIADEISDGSEHMKIEIQCGDKKFLLFDIPESITEPENGDDKPQPPTKPGKDANESENDDESQCLGLYAHVKTSYKWRRGRGFSVGELDAFGDFSVEIRCKIKVDKRRKTAHRVNIEVLKAIVKAIGDNNANSGEH